MAVFKPFRGYRPKPEFVDKIASPPYDVLNSEEAAEMAKDNDLSFLHVVKPEIDLPQGTNIYDPKVYAKGLENLTRLVNNENLIRDINASYYVYEQQMGDHLQVGLMGAAGVDDYENDVIKKHEHTRPDKEDDRTRHVDTLNANAGPVFLTYQADNKIDGIINEIRKGNPTYNFTADDGIRHALWVVNDDENVNALEAAFKEIPALYVADGHHRSASGARVRALRKEANPDHTGQEGYNFFMAVCFPHDQLKILAYNRVIQDCSKHTPDEFLALLTVRFEIAPTGKPEPSEPHTFGMYMNGKWYKLTCKEGTYPENDPVNSLDSQILSDNIFSKILDINDLRTDNRVNFVGGIRGTRELERLVDSGKWAIAFSLYPTSVPQLMKVADAAMVMPPKSTWFEPKLRSGIVVRMLDE